MDDSWYAGIDQRRREVQSRLGAPYNPERRPLRARFLNFLGELFVVLPLAVLGMGLLNLSDKSNVPHDLGEQWLGVLICLPFAWAIGGGIALAADGDAAKDPGKFALALYAKAPLKFAVWALCLALLGFILFGFSQGFAHFGHAGY